MTLMSPERGARAEWFKPACTRCRQPPRPAIGVTSTRRCAPALRVKSGDFVRAEAITHHAGDAPELLMDEAITALFDGIPESDRNPGVHLMTGPIYVEGAKKGDVLEVRYLHMTPRVRYGSNLAANWGHLYKEFGETERVTIYEIDESSQNARALFAYDVNAKYLTPGRITHEKDCCRQPALKGIRVPVRPHLGTAGVAPDARAASARSRPASMAATSTIGGSARARRCTIPIDVDGALFSIGDPHISQGDGEISGTAIEASLDVMFQLVLRKDFSIPSPLAGNAAALDLPWLRRGPQRRDAQCLDGDARPADRTQRPCPRGCLFADEYRGRLLRDAGCRRPAGRACAHPAPYLPARFGREGLDRKPHFGPS